MIYKNLIFDWIAGETDWKNPLNIFAIVADSVIHFPLLRIGEEIWVFLLFIDIINVMLFQFFLYL